MRRKPRVQRTQYIIREKQEMPSSQAVYGKAMAEDLQKMTFNTSSNLVPSSNTIRDEQEKVRRALEAGSSGELSEIREVSLKLYNKKGVYWNNVHFVANLPSLDYVIVPSFEIEDSEDRIKKIYTQISAYCDDILDKSEIRNLLISVIRDGAYYAYERQDGKTYYMQKLDNELCRKGRAIMNGLRTVEFNFSHFDDKEEEYFELFPSEFKTLYTEYQNAGDEEEPEWRALDVRRAIGIWSEEDTPEVPIFSRLFSDLLEEEEYFKNLARINNNDTFKLLQQKLPFDEKMGATKAVADVTRQFHQALMNVVPEGVDAITTPFEIEEINASKSKSDKETGIDKVQRRVRQSSGISPYIFEDAQNVSGIKANMGHNSRLAFEILEKVEKWLKKRFVEFAPNKYRFKLEFLRVTDADRDDVFGYHSQLVAYGGSIIPLISASGMNVDSYMGLLEMEKLLKVKDKLIVPQSAHTSSGDDEGGRPEVKDSETGEENKDKGSNEGRDM